MQLAVTSAQPGFRYSIAGRLYRPESGQSLGHHLPALWVCNNRTGTFNVYGADGTPTATQTTVPPAPGKSGPGSCTGAVRNANTAAFQVSAGVNGTFVLDTEDGLITIRSGTKM